MKYNTYMVISYTYITYINAGRPQGFNVDSVQIPYMIFFNPYISVHKTQYQIRTFRT